MTPAQKALAIPHANAHIGDALVRDGLLSQAHLDEALGLQARWGTRLGDILLAKGWVRAFDFYRTLSVQFDLPFVDLLKSPPDEKLFAMGDLDLYTQSLYLPWKQEKDGLLIAVADPSESMLAQLKDRYGSRCASSSRPNSTLSGMCSASPMHASPTNRFWNWLDCALINLPDRYLPAARSVSSACWRL